VTSLAVCQKYGLTDKVVVGYVGGFQQWHHLDLLLQAAVSLIETIPHIHFLLVGDDPDQRVERMACEWGLSDWFTFPGGISHSEVPSYLNAMDITILPSTLPYMSPMKIYEYMAMGKPVIAPNKNSLVEEVIIPNRNGLWFEAENADSMKHAIITLANAPELRQKMGKEARKSVENNYTWYHQVSNLIQAFQLALR
jgi:glycosyltransferase involved in cell wall biosynthesis